MRAIKNFEQLGRELEKRGKTEEIRQLAESADGQRLGKMLDQGAIERAAKSGDAAALHSLLGAVLSTEEGKRLAENVRKMMES